MKKYLFCIVVVIFNLPILLSAEEQIKEPQVKFSLLSSSKEFFSSQFEILGPPMGMWGRLGLHVGSQYAWQTDDEGYRKQVRNTEWGVSWVFEGMLQRIAIDNQAIDSFQGISTSLRLGRARFRDESSIERENREYIYWDTEVSYLFRSLLASPPPHKWVKGSAIGIGLGIRNNFLPAKPIYLGNRPVETGHVYPTIQFSLYY